MRRERPIAVEVPTEAPIVEAPEVVEAPRPRIVRFPLSIRLTNRVGQLSERIDALSTDPSVLESVESEIASIFDAAVDGADKSTGEEKIKLELLSERLQKAGEGIEEMNEGRENNNRVTYRRGYEKLRRYTRGQ